MFSIVDDRVKPHCAFNFYLRSILDVYTSSVGLGIISPHIFCHNPNEDKQISILNFFYTALLAYFIFAKQSRMQLQSLRSSICQKPLKVSYTLFTWPGLKYVCPLP
jgi:hypothetical protein